MESELVLHNGGCHCKNVRWHVQAPTSVVAWKCNCSNCSMRGTIHFVVPRQRFELLGDSKEFITTYTFGTHTAKHTFCKVCGITSFYTQRSNPNGIAVTLACLEPGTLSHVEIRNFDGKNWEDFCDQSGIALQSKIHSTNFYVTSDVYWGFVELDAIFSMIISSSISPFCDQDKQDKLVLTIVVVGIDSELVLHYGGCHCKNVRWHVQAPTSVVAWKCNCSNCSMRGTIHFVVPRQRFELLGDLKEFITTYTFGTHTAKHTFCKVCGITSFYTQRSNPNGIAVTLACLDLGTFSHVEIRHFDGKNL
ncbi:Centromere V [Gossypium australe]|uniref:Centromere V n=1 Tax=Gossypium australe TaxID=47621 RepID=A0A5B6VGY1_9ROSI|nr:Centromere V [Gossypium australe]